MLEQIELHFFLLVIWDISWLKETSVLWLPDWASITYEVP